MSGQPSPTVEGLTESLVQLSRLRRMVASGEFAEWVHDSGATMTEVAAEVGVSLATVSRWASGERRPTGAGARALAELVTGKGWISAATRRERVAVREERARLARWQPRVTLEEAKELSWWFDHRGGTRALDEFKHPELAGVGTPPGLYTDGNNEWFVFCPPVSSTR